MLIADCHDAEAAERPVAGDAPDAHRMSMMAVAGCAMLLAAAKPVRNQGAFASHAGHVQQFACSVARYWVLGVRFSEKPTSTFDVRPSTFGARSCSEYRRPNTGHRP